MLLPPHAPSHTLTTQTDRVAATHTHTHVCIEHCLTESYLEHTRIAQQPQSDWRHFSEASTERVLFHAVWPVLCCQLLPVSCYYCSAITLQFSIKSTSISYQYAIMSTSRALQLYLCASIRGESVNKSFINQLIGCMKQYGVVLTEHIGYEQCEQSHTTDRGEDTL